jgi:DNA-binding MarR family transcriptional regulator
MPGRKGSIRRAASDLNSAAIHLLRGLSSVDRQAGLTAARLSALSVLVFGGPTTLGRLARLEGVTPPTMTRIVDGLEALGLARREAHPESARAILVVATPEGVRLMEQARQRRLDVITEVLRTMRPDDRAAILGASDALLRLADRIPSAAREQHRGSGPSLS